MGTETETPLNDIPGSFTRGKVQFEDGSETPNVFEIKLTEGNFQCTPGDYEDIEVRVRGIIDSVLKGGQGTTTAQLSAYVDKATSVDKPKILMFINGRTPPNWRKVDTRIEKFNFNVRFICYKQDKVTVDFELLLTRCTATGSFQEGPINQITLNVKSYDAFPTVPGEVVVDTETA